MPIGQADGDGGPSCFSDVKDTGIPDLQQWCHSLTLGPREITAQNTLKNLKIFATSIKTYIEGIGYATEADCKALRKKWESFVPDFRGYKNKGPNQRLAIKVDMDGEPIGISSRLSNVCPFILFHLMCSLLITLPLGIWQGG